jgi:hypothetical protein
MIGPKCECGKELNEPGALLFGPPQMQFDLSGDEIEVSKKIHLCVDCFKFVAWFARGLRGGGTPPGLMWWLPSEDLMIKPEDKDGYDEDLQSKLVPVIVVS